MSEIDIEGAMEALEAELPDEAEDDSAPVSEADAVEESGEQSEGDSFTGFDPNVLPEDMQKVYKSMQADYTRKTQEVAEMRRQYEAFSEAGVDPNEAVGILNLWQAMDSDPDVARQFVSAMQNRLQELGYVEGLAEDTSPDVNYSYEGLPPDVANELAEMRAFRDQFAMAQEQQALVEQLEVVENTIRTTNPHYSDDDIAAIYDLAYSTDGDLMQASERYHGIQQRLLGAYLESKQVPHGATPGPKGPSSVPGRSFESLDDAHKAALEAVRNIS